MDSTLMNNLSFPSNYWAISVYVLWKISYFLTVVFSFTLLAMSLSCNFAKALRPLFCVLEYEILKQFYTLHFFHHLVSSVALFVLAYNKNTIVFLVVVVFSPHYCLVYRNVAKIISHCIFVYSDYISFFVFWGVAQSFLFETTQTHTHAHRERPLHSTYTYL